MFGKHQDDENPPCVSPSANDPILRGLNGVIRLSVRILAVLMTFVILWGTLDVVWVLYQRMASRPYFLLEINDILATFGAFMAVLIAIEIFENIVMYLEHNYIQIRLVLATALMASARKVIVFDFKELSADYIWATGGVILALGLVYWLLAVRKGDVRRGMEVAIEEMAKDSRNGPRS